MIQAKKQRKIITGYSSIFIQSQLQHGVAAQPCFSSTCYNDRSKQYTDQSTSLQIAILCLMFMEVYTMKNVMQGTQLQNPYAAYLQWLNCTYDLESEQRLEYEKYWRSMVFWSQVHRLKRCGDEKFIIQKLKLKMTFSLHYEYVFDFNDTYCTHTGSYLYIITINYKEYGELDDEINYLKQKHTKSYKTKIKFRSIYIWQICWAYLNYLQT